MTQDIKARISLDGAPAFAGQGRAAADSLGDIVKQLQRIAVNGDELQRLTGNMADLAANARTQGAAIQQLATNMQGVASQAERAGAGLRGMFAGGATIAGATLLADRLIGLGTEILQVQVRAETLQNSLRFAVGADVGREIDYLRRVTGELGLEFTSASKAYAGFAAAARDTRLEGDGARQVFESVAKASAVMGLSAANTEGVLLALQQMMSKGTVQAEELRGQLGERLPGAFQIAARSMGVTTAELGKMLETGKVLADDFLPKFAQQLNKELGEGATNAANRTEGAINRLSNAYERFKQSDGGAKADFLAGQLNIATDALNDYSQSVEGARARGDGFFGQLLAGAGAVARFLNPFNALSYSAQDTGAKLKAAEGDLAALRRELDTNPGNILLRESIQYTESLIARLKQAQAETAKLAAPTDAELFNRSQQDKQRFYADQARGVRDSEAAVIEIRNKAIGVNKDWVSSLNQLDEAQRRGVITEAERIKIVQKLTAETYKAGGATDVFARMQAEIIKTIALNDSRAQAGGMLSKAQQLEIDLNTRLTESLKSMSKAQAERIRQLIAVAVASASSAESVERERKGAEQIARARSDARQAETKGIDDHLAQVKRERDAVLKSVADRVNALEDEAEAVRITAGSNKSLAEGIELVALARAREKAERYTEGSEPYLDVQREIEARERLLNLMADKRVREANTKAAEKAADDWERTTDGIRSGLTDAIRRALESGDDPIKAFGKALGNEVKTQLLAALATALGNSAITLLLGQAVASGSGGGTSGTGTANNLLQLGSSANSLYNLYNGGGLYGSALAAANYGTVYSGAAYGTAFGSQQSAMLAAQEAGMVSQAGSSTLSGWASSAGWIGAAILGAMRASADYSAGFRRDQARSVSDGIFGNFSSDFTPGGGIESAKANFLSQLGFSDRWADLLSGATAIAALFGRAAPKIEATGVMGKLGAGDFTGSAYADIIEKGGLFRSDKKYTETGALSDGLGKFLDDAAKGVFDKATAYGQALGLPVDALSKVTTDLKVEITDDAQKNLEALTTALTGYGDALVAGYADAIKPLAQYGETTVQTIDRVAGAITGVNSVLDKLGLAALQASINGGQAAVDLQNLFGDIGTLQSAAGSYLQNYYTDAERAKLSTKAIADVLANFGLSVPSTREAFRGLVEAQDLTTESGRKAFAALMGVADAFAAVTAAGRSAADIANERATLQMDLWRETGNVDAIRNFERNKLDPSNRDLFDQIELAKAQKAADEAAMATAEAAQKAAGEASQSWQAAQDAASNAAAIAAAATAQVMGSITDEVNRLRKSTGSATQTRSQLEQLFALTNTRARKGDLESARKLPGLSQQLEQVGVAEAASAQEANLYRATLAAQLERTVKGGGSLQVSDQLAALTTATTNNTGQLEQIARSVRDSAELWARLTNNGTAIPTEVAP